MITTHKSSLRTIRISTLLLMVSFSACMQPTPQPVVEHYTPGLAIQMKYMQHWTHKLGLSVEAENLELADFYHHELEHATEDLIESIENYGGFPIAQLTETMMVPMMDALEDALEAGNWTQIRSAYTAVITSCNTCHVATDHGFIVINEGFGNNPFNQDF